jgi:hypothetical protein
MCDYYDATRSTPGMSCTRTQIRMTYNNDPCVRVHVGVLRVGRTVQVIVITFQRKRMGPKYKGTVLFMKMLQHNVMPERVDNFYACAAVSDTTPKYVRVQDLCTILAEVLPRTVSPNMVNLVPIAHAFPVSWCDS